MSAKQYSKLSLGALAFAMALAVPSFAAAQQQEEEIIVTATKRATSIQDVPFSVNAQTQEDIQRTGAGTLEELSRNVAGLTLQNLGPGQSQVAIRGVSAGQIVRDQPGVKEQVGIYLDESVISLSLFTPDLDLFDLNRVETLRGPQGTLFGSGSVGGTLRYITNQPDPSGFAGLIEGNVNSLTDGGTGGYAKGMVNIPLANDAALRLVGYHTEYAGFIDALRTGGRTEDVNSGTRSGIRAALLFHPLPNLAITPRIVYQDTHADGFNRQEVFNLYANPFMSTPVTLAEREQFLLLDEEFDDETMIADLTAVLSLDNVDLTSVSSYVDRDILVSRDASALTGSVTIDLGFDPAAVLIPSNLRDTTQLQQFTQEFRISSNGDGPFQWLVGAFYADIERTYAQRLPTPGYDAAQDAYAAIVNADADPDNDFPTSAQTANGYGPDSPYNADLPYTLTQMAVFGEASYDVTDRLTLTAGGRYYDFEEERTFTSGGVFSNGDNRADSTESQGFTPRVMASYEVSDSVRLNAQASQGFRLGGVNDPLNVPLCTDEDEAIFGNFQSYDDETSWNYEAGVKVSRPGLTFNAAAFYNDIENLQVTLDAGSCSSRISFNVPEAHSGGVEFEISGSPAPGLELSFAGTVVNAEFDSTVVDGSDNVIGGLRTGNRLPSVPEYQLAATAAYYFPLQHFGTGNEGFVAASLQHVGSRFTQPSDQENNPRSFVSGLPFGGAPGTDATVVDLELEPYTTLNLNAGIENDVWALIVYVNNVTDENAELAFDRERGGRARLGFHVISPRTFGVTARRSF